MGIQMDWQDASRTLTLQFAEGSRMLPPMSRTFAVEVGREKRELEFHGPRVQTSI